MSFPTSLPLYFIYKNKIKFFISSISSAWANNLVGFFSLIRCENVSRHQ
ncbi:hypothetical protein BTG_22500 [Bacillus thuringiensis HD-771]|uniref:Uncharacterized protein n=1 Tax=Bacillus thuringiensis HD-771 TaxID=1218175 RepID=A0A9W3JCS7_BACTU|nr:hypothetical protein BTG_22500 [Bacillus thuringiensis HD-771]